MMYMLSPLSKHFSFPRFHAYISVAGCLHMYAYGQTQAVADQLLQNAGDVRHRRHQTGVLAEGVVAVADVGDRRRDVGD